jgi:cytochrome c oxidase subunit 4
MSAHGHSDDAHDAQDFAHPLPIPLLLAVFAALVGLTILTVSQASFDMGSYDVVIVMVIATIKASLVMAFFMHMAYDKPFNVICFLGSFVFVGLFVIFTLSDSRGTSDSFTPKVDDVVPVVVEMGK